MGLYQRSVLKNYLTSLDDSKVSAAYSEFKSFFFNPVTQQNIRISKEEQFQEGFLRELFVKIMGYTLNPDANYNLISEQKNVSDSKKADGAIIINGKVVGVIELKGTNTIDLGKIQQQAFYYLSAHPEAVYVITSNFEKLRFYIQKSNEYEEFNLFKLTLEEFKLLYLCTSFDSIGNGIPLKIKQESLVKEEIITKNLYKDYSNFKNDLFGSLCDRNTHLDKLTLFKATQKLIDRFLFIFFCEDNNGLLPANSIAEIIKHWNKLREMDEYRPLYDIFKKYFEYINSGRTAAGDKREIFAYNGGLFAQDILLDKLDIDDHVLYTHAQKLSIYDFISEVDVNILGHIFEHSLNDIEEIQAEIAGNVVDKSKTKRKKDGVFYTPKYITEYIVENTVGKLCADKKAALEIDEDMFVTANTKAKREPLLEKLNAYKSYLLGITICDPACGSGAFLNQAYVFLQKEHQYVADLESKLFDAPIVITDVSADILENNLFGVDINEESVEIARLALWLRSAKKGRKLNNLSNNIKCGNSLIDDPTVAGDKAFKWDVEFPQVFAKGGFDVVIGNPPYVRVEFISNDEVKYYKNNFLSSTGKFDLSSIFIEKSLKLLSSKGIYSVITSYQFLFTSSGLGLRSLLADKNRCDIIMFSSDSQVFPGATTYAGIFTISKFYDTSIHIYEANNINQTINFGKNYEMLSNNFKSEKVLFESTGLYENLVKKGEIIFGKQIGVAKTGVVTSSDDVYYLNSINKLKFNLEDTLVHPILGPDNLNKWIISNPEIYCLYPYYEDNGNTRLIPLDILKSDYPFIYEYLFINKSTLTQRSQGRKDYTESPNWYQLNRPREKWIYDSVKIVYPGTINKPKFALDEKGLLFRNARVYAYILKNEYTMYYKTILIILNSSLSKYIISLICPPKSNNYFELSTGFLENFPFILPDENIKTIYENIYDNIYSLNRSFYHKQSKFLSRIQSNLHLQNITGKLEKFYESDFKSFVGELKKQKLVLSLKDQDEWEDYFNTYKQEINTLQAEINKTDKEIDQMVYELYGLTEEEIKVVENNI